MNQFRRDGYLQYFRKGIEVRRGSRATVAAKNGELTLAIGSNLPVRLRPTFREAFMMQTTGIRFLRDANGIITGLSAGDDRVWDLRFTRVR